MTRLLAIGDIHGCSIALKTLLAVVQPGPEDKVITLGDYVDRGPDTKGVLDTLLALEKQTLLLPLRGNHEIMMFIARQGGRDDLRFWLTFGGGAVLQSYAPPNRMGFFDDIPLEHWNFLEKCSDWLETDGHIFVHANLNPTLPVAEQKTEALHWTVLNPTAHIAHVSGKVMICGHSEQRDGKPLDVGSAICIDTWAYGEGWLTCLDVISRQYWQANQLGQVREGVL